MKLLNLTALALFASSIPRAFSSSTGHLEEKVREEKPNLRNGLIVDRKLKQQEEEEEEEEEEEYVVFRSADHYGYCMDLSGGYTRNNNAVEMKFCDYSNSQLWSIMDDGTIRPYMDLEKCLHLKGSYNKNGSSIRILKCKDNYVYQQWIYDSGYIHPVGNENKCIDVKSKISNNLRIWNCFSYYEDKRWNTVPAEPYYGYGNDDYYNDYYAGYYSGYYSGYYDDYYGSYGKGYYGYGRRHGSY